MIRSGAPLHRYPSSFCGLQTTEIFGLYVGSVICIEIDCKGSREDLAAAALIGNIVSDDPGYLEGKLLMKLAGWSHVIDLAVN